MKKNKYKVLLCSPLDLSKGSGISRWCNHIQNYYTNNESSTIDLSIYPMDRTIHIDESINFIKRVYWGFKDYSHIIKGIHKRITKKEYDVVHITSSASISIFKDLYLLQILKKYSIKTIVHFHFGRIPELYLANNWEWKLICKVVKHATRIIVIDKASYETLLKAGFKNVSFLPNPLSPTIANIIKNNKEIIRNHRSILFTGHVYRTKGIYELIEACSHIPNINLKIVGKYEEPIKHELLKIAKQRKPEPWVEFTGNLPYEEVIKEMLRCNIFVLPTYTEGFPNVILESMACACPIITTNVGAIPEMLDTVQGDYCGKCISPRKVTELQKAIEFMLNNQEYAKRCGHNAQNRVNNYYSIPIVWNKMVDIWLKTIEI